MTIKLLHTFDYYIYNSCECRCFDYLMLIFFYSNIDNFLFILKLFLFFLQHFSRGLFL